MPTQLHTRHVVTRIITEHTVASSLHKPFKISLTELKFTTSGMSLSSSASSTG
ncbi:MAG: hypothetical protein GY865_02270, partial [candidate division Zixibacteria bacterium]|nr:hypothetical protein [candidate division Zixibacteria bacterium]